MHEKDQFSSKESVNNDSLECVSDNGGDSLDSSAQSEDSLQNLDDSLGKIKISTKLKKIHQCSCLYCFSCCYGQPFLQRDVNH